MHKYNWIAFALSNLAIIISASAPREAYYPVLLERSTTGSWGPFLDANAGQNAWMKDIPDDTLITNINIPGTHDTMTGALSNSSYEDNPFKTQLSPLSTMLNAGMRFIDIRCHHVSDKFQIWHSLTNTGKTFTDVLKDVNLLLTANPSETIIMRVLDENNYTLDSGTNKQTFGATYDWYQNENPDTKDIFANQQFKGPFNAWPKLADARGKFIVLVNFNPAPFTIDEYGFEYKNSGDLFDIEDAFEIKNDISEKWNAVSDHLDKVNAATDSDKLYITYCSATAALQNPGNLIKFTPFHVAIRYDVPESVGGYDGINKQLWSTMSGRTGRLGVVMFDFAGQDLVDSLINKNFKDRNSTIHHSAAQTGGVSSCALYYMIPILMVFCFY